MNKHTAPCGDGGGISRRKFIHATAAGTAALPALGLLSADHAFAQNELPRAPVFRVNDCPIHDGKLRHVGVDSLLRLLAGNGTKLYKTNRPGELNGPEGLVAADDVVVLKVNAQWKCRGGTNTDLLRGLIHRILQHPEGFRGEVVIFENGQGRPASFDGLHNDNNFNEYRPFPELLGKVMVNAEEQELLTIDYLTETVFRDKPVSSLLMDPFTNVFIAADDHKSNGYRRVGDAGTACVSYPCFTTPRGHRVELKEGVWSGGRYRQNLKWINCAVLKDHSGDIGFTGALKIVYGTLSMRDGTAAKRHYQDLGSQCARMWTQVRAADLNILDCIWVSYGSMEAAGQHVSGCIGYPAALTSRRNILLAGFDPVAMDYHAAKHILLPLGGASAEAHDPDRNPRLLSVYRDARDTINASGGIHGRPSQAGDGNIQVTETPAADSASE